MNCTESMWKVLTKSQDEIEVEQFWKVVDIWNQNPHTVNRRIHSAVSLFFEEFEDDLDPSSLKHLEIKDSDLSADVWNTIKTLHLEATSCTSEKKRQVFVKKLLPRNVEHFKVAYELVILDKNAGSAYFCLLGSQEGANLIPKFPYRLFYDSNIFIEIPANQSISDPSAKWLQSHLLNSLVKWANSTENASPKSHTLISKDKYATIYQTLKKKYGKEIIKIWPECTDPVKFVHEDVAIASYLILLWEGSSSVSFADLGCGNGLLVHILNSEGHRGIGIDVRDRKIWKLYPDSTKLEVRSITPSDSCLFPDVDWLVGNHSDELTPWIPVIAARSSRKCKFFVLPCCPYDFDGLRYRRKNSLVSQYSDFLEYLQHVSEGCGFETKVDRLRIPSTKRICLVGRERTYCEKKWDEVNGNINKLIETGRRNLSCERESTLESNNLWMENFKPRESKEEVRNCTQLDKCLIDEIVMLVANHLLIKRRLLTLRNKIWNAGGIVTISELVPLIATDKLKQLKNEFGGLQTLLKNNHQVFLVQKGKVQLRLPISLAETNQNGKAQTKYKPCWFHNYHPDGCIHTDKECAFVHGQEIGK